MITCTLHRRAAVLTFLGLWLAGIACAQDKGSFFSDGRRIDIAVLNKEVENMMDEVGVPGLSLAVMERGKIVFYHTYGYKKLPEKEKVNKRTVFEAASLSKSYLVFAVFRLVDEGRLDLDKPLYQYLPNDELAYDPRYKKITARMVLSHSSGLENWKWMNNPDTLEILSDPGTKFVYSGAGYNYLAQVVQSILGQPYEGYIRDLVTRPLKLRRSFVLFKQRKLPLFPKESPSNYATGHDDYEKAVEKWKNREPVPSSANNVTARDYAKLMLATLDGKHLSPGSVRTILQPVISTGRGYYGTGYEIIYEGGDTILAHGGDNLGFKAQAFYSVKNHRGFVFLTNSERGKLLAMRLCELTARLPVQQYYANNFPFRYPDPAVSLFKIYRTKGRDAMLAALDSCRRLGLLHSNSLACLGWDIMDKDIATAKQLMEEGIRRFPESPMSYGFLGELYAREKGYTLAYDNYSKASDLHFVWWDNEEKLNSTRKLIEDSTRRAAFMILVSGGAETTIRAENYNRADGAETGPTVDSGQKQIVAHLGTGNWMDYRVGIAATGKYRLSVRISSLLGGCLLQLRSEDSVLAGIRVASTGNWDTWVTLNADVHLPKGRRMLRLYEVSGDRGVNINWLRLSPIRSGSE